MPKSEKQSKIRRAFNRLMHRSSGQPVVDDQECRRDITCRAFQFRAGTYDDKTRSIEAVIATDERVLVFDMCNWEVIEEVLIMDGVRVPDQLPYIDTHMRFTITAMLGSTRNMRVEGGKLIGRNFFADTDLGRDAESLARDGHLTDNSVGYKIHNSATIDAGKTVEVEGVKYTASPTRALRVTFDWEPHENSACPIGADPAAKNRNNSTKQLNRKEIQMDPKFKAWLEVRGWNVDGMEDEQKRAQEIIFKADKTRGGGAFVEPVTDPPADTTVVVDDGQRANNLPVVDPTKAAADAVVGERQRVTEIRAAAIDGNLPETIERCVNEGMTVDAARAVFLEEIRTLRPKPVSAPNIITGGGEMNREILSDAIILRSGNADMVVDLDQSGNRAERANQYRDMSLIDVCRMALQIDGQAVPHSRQEMIRAAIATASLPIILGEIINKFMLKGYMSTPQTWREWCNIGSVSDFKTITKVRLTDIGELEEVGNAGEVASGGAVEEYEQYKVSRYAKKFGITDQNIIDDDLSVFTRTPQRMGNSAANLVLKLVYVHLLANAAMQDGTALFHADHNNLNTGSALAAGTLKVAIQKFMDQVDKDGQPISVQPTKLLLPTGLRFTAADLLQGEAIVRAGDTDVVTGSANTLKGTLKPVVEPRLSNSSYTGYSATTWYVTGDPAQGDTVEVSFLNGQQNPTIQRFDGGVDMFGIWFRVHQDVAAKAMDHRTMQKNTA